MAVVDYHVVMRSLSLIMLLGLTGSAFAQPKSTGKPWIDMDYGPYLSSTVEAPIPAGNFAYKGLTIRLDGERSVVFDTDTLRFAAGWAGGLDLKGVVFDGGHWTFPNTSGEIAFANPVGPGWGKAGTTGDAAFIDDRFVGKDGRRFGPLSKAWGRWNGLYLHDNRIVLSYTLGGEGSDKVAVLESPASERVEGLAFFTRTIEVGPSTRPLVMQVSGIDEPVLAQGAAGGASWRIVGRDAEARADDAAVKAAADKGLVAHFTFDEARDGVIASVTGKDHAIKASAVELADGVSGKAIRMKEKMTAILADGATIKLAEDFTIGCWVQTKADGTIIAKAPSQGIWKPQGRSLFVRGGRLVFDVGWVGALESKRQVADGQWHHVAVTFEAKTKLHSLFIDGTLDHQSVLRVDDDDKSHVIKLGYTATDFPSANNWFKGRIDELRIYNRTLPERELVALAGQKQRPPALVALGCVAEAEGIASWETTGGNVRLVIAPHDKPVRIKVLIARSTGAAGGDSKALIAAIQKAAAPQDLTPLIHGGPTRFAKKITTEGKLGSATKGKNIPWAVDEITWPVDNPWKSWMRFGGFDFFKDPTKAAICTWSGDVWLVTGITDDLKQLTWQRIATGLFQPLGLRIVDEQIYICGRDQITRLHDLNGDGETDFYENFNNDHQVTEHFHEFAMDLQTDKEGNFYYAKSARHALDSLVEQHGTLMKVSRDGSKSQIIANGFRAANGVGIGPSGEMFSSDQEGHWMPANRINLLREGGFYGNMFSYHRGTKPTDYIRPVVWLPKGFDRSPAEQLFVDSDRWGLPRGTLLSTSYGTGSVLAIAFQPVKGDPLVDVQGAAVKLPLVFPTGIMRGRFHPADGQLYVAGLFGWAGDRSSPGGFWRIRHTGAKVHMPVQYEIARGTITLGFTSPLDEDTAKDAGSYLVEAWNYKWAADYGSPEFKVSDGQRGRDTWKVESVTVSKDHKTVTLHVPTLTRTMQVRIKYALEAEGGDPVEQDVYGSIFVVP
jgi:hypothetical protein